MTRNYFIHATYFLLTLAIWIPGWRYQANNTLLEQFSPSNPFFAEEVQRVNSLLMAQDERTPTYGGPKNNLIFQRTLFVDSLCHQVDYSTIGSDKQIYQIFKDTFYQRIKPLLDSDTSAETHLDNLLDINKVPSLSTVPFTYGQLFDLQKAIINPCMQNYFYQSNYKIECGKFSFFSEMASNILFPSNKDTFLFSTYLSVSAPVSWRFISLTGRINNQEYEGQEGAIRYQTTFREPGKQPLAMELCLTNSKNDKMVLRDTVWVNVQK